MTAHAVPVRHSLRIKNLPDLVRRVTIDAGRNYVGLLLPQLPADHLAMHLLDLGMTFRAGCRDVLFCDGRTGIGVGQYEMRGMTTGADGRNGEAALVQALAVNTVHVVAEDIVLRDVPGQLNRRTFLMATAAQLRDLHYGSWRTLRGRTQDVVTAVAIFATRRQRIATLDGPSMETFGELLLLVGVTASAIDRRQFVCVGEFFGIDVGVAAIAFDGGVGGSTEGGGVERGWDACLPLPVRRP